MEWSSLLFHLFAPTMKKMTFKHIWGIFMAVIFLAMGVLTMFTNYFATMGGLRYVFGVVFFIFSFYRAYQIWQEYRS
jgi:hypothetical protein